MGSIGQSIDAWVNAEDDFVWYAYSFNSTEEITLPDRNNPEIRTSVNDPLLYATGTILQSSLSATGNNPLQIEFIQKLSKVEIELDTRSLFADITAVQGHFVGDPIVTGTFNVKLNQIGNATNEDVGVIQFRNVEVRSPRLKTSVQNYYTVKTNLTSYSVQFTEFKIKHPNRLETDLLTKLNNNGIAQFSGFLGTQAKLLKGTLKPYLVMPAMKFLTYGTESTDLLGLQARATTPSGQFLRSATNIGPNSKYIRITSPTFTDLYAVSGTNNLAEAISENAPDVLICNIYDPTKVPDGDLNALVDYLLSGGTVFLLTGTTDPRITNAFKTMMGEPNLSLETHGVVYKLGNVDPKVLNGIFGDIRNTYWGQHSSLVQHIKGIGNINNLEVYTREASNYSPINTGITMFRHKNRHLFFCGDLGFLAGSSTLTNYNSVSAYPYRIDPSTYFPILRSGYGSTSLGGSNEIASAGSWTATNSFIFANALAWLVERAYFYGRDASGTVVNDETIQTSEKNWNYRRD